MKDLSKETWMVMGSTDQHDELKNNLDLIADKISNNETKPLNSILKVLKKSGLQVKKTKPLNKRSGDFKGFTLEEHLQHVCEDTRGFIKEIVIHDILWVLKDHGYTVSK